MSIKLSILVRRAWQSLIRSKVESIIAHGDVLDRNKAKIESKKSFGKTATYPNAHGKPRKD